MPHARIVTAQGQALQSALREARARAAEIFRFVRPEAIYDRPIPERHRLVFYLGHLEAFDWNLICRGAFEMDSFHPEFDRLFAFGIDPVDGGLPSDQPSDWPALEKIRAYVSRVQQNVDDCLSEFASGGQDDDASLLQRFHVAIEHRLMHAETLAYMLHQLPLDRKFPGPVAPAETDNRAQQPLIEIPAGMATLGLRRTGDAFGWDNEFEEHAVNVPAFRIQAHKVTNAEWLEFRNAGGYAERSLWSDSDWNWRVKNGVSHPIFWKPAGGQWRYRTMFGEIPLPGGWPVYVSHAEAAAYARWKGLALPTEAQFHRAAYGTPEGSERMYPWGDAQPTAHHGNFDFASWEPAPVGSFPDGNSAFGISDLVGNGWEWTSTVFAPFEGFEPFSFYPGYSADFFDGKHYVIAGGSARTAACMLRRSFRNWFQSHYQYMYAGFRCVQN